ncbi:ABC transporter permease subunit [Ancylobacter sp. 6x-1]|uniref:ABC transporter permease subunit n=1 Tax=Ancylobacter crimeensis TaxID=2579147 RepID=A0ABT0D5U0_9HYPH|nr:ABC transporter permease subunit [Ancylobacter crimeensis]MCK0195310.1 ABC transporter permease subunit [Ancylobacter crimeensis]
MTVAVPVPDAALPFIVPAEGIPAGVDDARPHRTEAAAITGAGPSAQLWISLATIAGFLVLWWAVTASGAVAPLFLPSPEIVVARLGRLATEGFVDGTLAQHLGASLLRVFAALGAALVLGIPAGFAIGSSPIGRGVLDPVIEFLRPIPPLAYLPLIIIWAGIGEAAKVLVIALAMLPPIVIATAAGMEGVDRNRLNIARALGASRVQLFRHVVFPSTLPSILTGTRIALGAGWSTLVASELVAATRGVGFMIQSAANFLATDVVIAGILVIAAVAFAFECGVRVIERLFVGWSRRG